MAPAAVSPPNPCARGRASLRWQPSLSSGKTAIYASVQFGADLPGVCGRRGRLPGRHRKGAQGARWPPPAIANFGSGWPSGPSSIQGGRRPRPAQVWVCVGSAGFLHLGSTLLRRSPPVEEWTRPFRFEKAAASFEGSRPSAAACARKFSSSSAFLRSWRACCSRCALRMRVESWSSLKEVRSSMR